MKPISVMLVDDHKLFREGIRALLQLYKDIEIICEASNGLDALSKVEETLPDLILMDVQMPIMNGVEATQLIKARTPSVRIVMLSASDEDNDLFGAIKAGAQGYVLKNTPSEELVRQIKGVMKGEAPLSGLMATKILAEFNMDTSSKLSQKDRLTNREEEVLHLIGLGNTNKEISGILSITESTVKKHVQNILDKLHLRNRVEAALFAQGILPPTNDI
ncbi:response regulator [Desulfosporosinus shakirovi]|uniref:response regulator n=1 Tax=Desulfosporosinus shakirovi TaxID=2885154 RepID=UPI001E3A0400|nr:response regulator transcription factor [Desulfosporosinus sp. SRJS8]MCB8814940.1 response regulator transcription factor [Desulfosporosinus sp. SRJS8]